MRRFVDLVEKISSVLAYICGAMVFFMMVSIIYDVVLRHILNQPTIWADEVSCYLLVGISFLGAAYALKTDAHVRIETFVERLSPRARNAMEMITDVLSLGFLFIFAWQGYRLVIESFVYVRIAPTLMRTPLYLPQASLAVGLSWFWVQMLAHILKRFVPPQAEGGRK
jgi:C4-dicarboxylate transporter DctQ subunit